MGKTAVFITVRSDSSRLPGKCFRTIGKETVIQHVINRAKLVNVDEIVLCTTNRLCDDEFVEVAKENSIQCFRGSLQNKLLRWYGACDYFDITHFATFDADDPFCDPYLMEKGLKQLIENEIDMIKTANGMICGAFTYAISFNALKKVLGTFDTSNSEMIEDYFCQCNVQEINETDLVFYSSKIRLTLDYYEDFKFFTKVYLFVSFLAPLSKIVETLMKNYDLIDINSHLMDKWKENQRNARIAQGS